VTREQAITAEQQQRVQSLSPRALILGLVLVIAFTVAGCFCVFLRYEIIGTGYLPRGAVAILLLLLLWNAAVRRVARRLELKPPELALIFVMLMAMGAIPGQEFAQHVYLNQLGLVHYTLPEIAPPDLYLDQLNPLLVPDVNREAGVIKWAYEGLPPGQEVPYRSWVRPLLVWTPFWFALYWVILCFTAIMAPRWEEQEKVLYPLVQVPVELAEPVARTGGPLLKNKLLWGCFGFSVLLYVIKGLHTYFPGVPDLNLQRDAGIVISGGPLSVYNRLPLHFYPEMVGIAYLLTAEVGFSIWFFYHLQLLETAVRQAFGIWTNHYQFFEFQTAGGYVVLGLALLWSARRHVGTVVRAVVGSGEDPSDPRNPQPYRLATFGLVLGLIFIFYWCTEIGLSLGWAMVQYLLFPLVSMVVARVVCEAGMFIYSSPFRLNDMIFNVFGAHRIGAQNVTLMTMTSWAQIRSTATQNMPAIFQGFKMGSMAKLNRPQLLGAMFGAVCLAILVSHATSPYVIYKWSIPKLGWWPRGSSLGTVTRLVSFLKSPHEMTWGNWGALGLGGVMTLFLVGMRQRFTWWPFHPLGFVAWIGWPTSRYWLSIFMGWLAKVVVVRFFGFATFRKLRPGAFGLILGICFILTVWIVLHFVWEGPTLIIE